MGYVAKARKNTDINNAAAIESSLAVLTTDKNVCKWATDNAGKSTDTVTITWSTSDIKYSCDESTSGKYKITLTGTTDNGTTALATAGYDTTDGVGTIFHRIAHLLPDGLPKSKSSNYFKLTIKTDSAGSPSVMCKVYTDTDCTTKLEGAEE